MIQRTSKPRQADLSGVRARPQLEVFEVRWPEEGPALRRLERFFVEVDGFGVFWTFKRGVVVRPRRRRRRGRGESPRPRRATPFPQGDSIPFRVKKDDNQLTMDPVVDENESEEEQEERTGSRPARAGQAALAPSAWPSRPRLDVREELRGLRAAVAPPPGPDGGRPVRSCSTTRRRGGHGKACTGEDDGRRRSPVQRGDNKCFPAPRVSHRCPPAAPARRVLVAQSSRRLGGDSSLLLREIRGERERNRYANLEELRPALTRAAWHAAAVRAGYCGVSTPANFPRVLESVH